VARSEAKSALFDAFASVAQAVGSGRRAEIVDVLAQGERSVDEIAGEIGQSVANTSQHLQVLARAGLVGSRREGTRIYYRLASERVVDLWVAVRDVAVRQVAEVSVLADEYLGIPGARSAPLPALEALAAKLPRRREVVAYCRGPYCVYADDAVRLLRQRGLKARRLDVGFPEWKRAGRPVEAAS
jgi:DNA-binding transcriptional ArsR family regulator